MVFYSHWVDIVSTLDTDILPYVLFLIVPVLGRVSDTDDAVRKLATSTFAALVKLVPLEVCSLSLFFYTILTSW